MSSTGEKTAASSVSLLMSVLKPLGAKWLIGVHVYFKFQTLLLSMDLEKQDCTLTNHITENKDGLFVLINGFSCLTGYNVALMGLAKQ